MSKQSFSTLEVGNTYYIRYDEDDGTILYYDKDFNEIPHENHDNLRENETYVLVIYDNNNYYVCFGTDLKYPPQFQGNSRWLINYIPDSNGIVKESTLITGEDFIEFSEKYVGHHNNDDNLYVKIEIPSNGSQQESDTSPTVPDYSNFGFMLDNLGVEVYKKKDNKIQLFELSDTKKTSELIFTVNINSSQDFQDKIHGTNNDLYSSEGVWYVDETNSVTKNPTYIYRLNNNNTVGNAVDNIRVHINSDNRVMLDVDAENLSEVTDEKWWDMQLGRKRNNKIMRVDINNINQINNSIFKIP